MQSTKNNISCDYAYIQHTLFGNEVDVVYVRKDANNSLIETSIIICDDMKEAIKILDVTKLKNK
jgi:hypothetical protein